jgi:subtilisin family serine protease
MALNLRYRKLIGARYYDLGEVNGAGTRSSSNSPRDEAGHGTHTSSTAAGNAVTGASYYGLASGTAKGGSAASRLAMYRVCSDEGCAGSAILAGFDDAIGDGVDVISVSLGASPFFNPDFSEDPIAIGSFHAVAKGVMVVCSAGNSGPDPSTVVNAAPWIMTVAATTIDRDFESDVVLGGNRSAVKVCLNLLCILTLTISWLIFTQLCSFTCIDAGGSYKLLQLRQIPEIPVDHRCISKV